MSKKVILGFSGGVDSFFAAYLLKKAGFDVIPVYFKLLRSSNTDKVEKSAELLKLKPVIIDLTEEFEKHVIKYFVDYYSKGLTPNPCIVCNRDIKLNHLFKLMQELKASFISTGHYARVKWVNEFQSKLIGRGADRRKEQSYFLSLVNKKIIPFLVLPLGEWKKERVIEKAKKLGYPFESESQDICFIDSSYVDFLEKFLKPKEGFFVLKNGTIIGKHKGFYRFTVGQRRGLGVSYKKPLYVLSLEPETNRVVLGEKEDVFKDAMCIWKASWHVKFEKIRKLNGLEAQVRYRTKPQAVKKIEYFKSDIYCVKLAAKVEAPAPGQVCAFYYNDLLLGGGEITREGEKEWLEASSQ